MFMKSSWCCMNLIECIQFCSGWQFSKAKMRCLCISLYSVMTLKNYLISDCYMFVCCRFLPIVLIVTSKRHIPPLCTLLVGTAESKCARNWGRCAPLLCFATSCSGSVCSVPVVHKGIFRIWSCKMHQASSAAQLIAYEMHLVLTIRGMGGNPLLECSVKYGSKIISERRPRIVPFDFNRTSVRYLPTCPWQSCGHRQDIFWMYLRQSGTSSKCLHCPTWDIQWTSMV